MSNGGQRLIRIGDNWDNWGRYIVSCALSRLGPGFGDSVGGQTGGCRAPAPRHPARPAAPGDLLRTRRIAGAILGLPNSFATWLHPIPELRHVANHRPPNSLATAIRRHTRVGKNESRHPRFRISYCVMVLQLPPNFRLRLHPRGTGKCEPKEACIASIGPCVRTSG
jgi:hypothetical protein